MNQMIDDAFMVRLGTMDDTSLLFEWGGIVAKGEIMTPEAMLMGVELMRRLRAAADTHEENAQLRGEIALLNEKIKGLCSERFDYRLALQRISDDAPKAEPRPPTAEAPASVCTTHATEWTSWFIANSIRWLLKKYPDADDAPAGDAS